MASNFQSSAPVLGSKAYTQPSPPPNTTSALPFASPKDAFDQLPWMIFSPGRLLSQTSLPVFLSRAMKLGALGEGMLMCPSSTPLPVVTYTRSPTTMGELAARLWGKTSASPIMSNSQITSPSISSLYFSVVIPSFLPSRNPSVSRQTMRAWFEV